MISSESALLVIDGVEAESPVQCCGQVPLSANKRVKMDF